jgi:hypothetical protein
MKKSDFVMVELADGCSLLLRKEHVALSCYNGECFLFYKLKDEYFREPISLNEYNHQAMTLLGEYSVGVDE